MIEQIIVLLAAVAIAWVLSAVAGWRMSTQSAYRR